MVQLDGACNNDVAACKNEYKMMYCMLQIVRLTSFTFGNNLLIFVVFAKSCQSRFFGLSIEVHNTRFTLTYLPSTLQKFPS